VVPELLPESFDLVGRIFLHSPIIYPGIRRKVIASYRKTNIIFNPQAGRLKGRGREGLETAARILRESGHEVTLVPTTGPGTAGEIARRAIAEGADLIVAAGGDGTVNEVLEGMVHSTVPLGILPAGTANVLAMETGMSTKLETAARALAGYSAERISVGRIHFSNGAPGSRHFLLMAGIGLDARIVYNISVPLKRQLGKAAYWVAGWSLLGRSLDEFEVKIDGRVRACSFALVSKVRNYGGDLEIARDTSLLDDRFEVVLFEGRSTLRYVKYLTGVMLNRLKGMSGVSVLRAEKICVSPVKDARVYIQIDGEHAGHLPGSVEIVRNALTVLIPPKYKERPRAGGR
jgi:YegS/Rv2252/BmrU family lipid kinase